MVCFPKRRTVRSVQDTHRLVNPLGEYRLVCPPTWPEGCAPLFSSRVGRVCSNVTYRAFPSINRRSKISKSWIRCCQPLYLGPEFCRGSRRLSSSRQYIIPWTREAADSQAADNLSTEEYHELYETKTIQERASIERYHLRQIYGEQDSTLNSIVK